MLLLAGHQQAAGPGNTSTLALLVGGEKAGLRDCSAGPDVLREAQDLAGSPSLVS